MHMCGTARKYCISFLVCWKSNETRIGRDLWAALLTRESQNSATRFRNGAVQLVSRSDGKKPADEDDTACTARTTDGGEPDCRAHRFTMMLWSNKRLAGVVVVADSTGTSWASTKFRSLSTRQVPSHDLSPSRQARELQLRSSATATTTQLLTSRHHHSHG
jgi:hypothetical protein